MNNFQLSCVYYAYEKVSCASKILRDHGFREAIPDAWISALMRLKKEVHVPESVRADFDFLAAEMSHCIESCQGGGPLRFLPDVDDDRIRAIQCAYMKLHGAVAHWIVDSLSELLKSASKVDAKAELCLVNEALRDQAFWAVAEYAESAPVQLLCARMPWQYQRIADSSTTDAQRLFNWRPPAKPH